MDSLGANTHNPAQAEEWPPDQVRGDSPWGCDAGCTLAVILRRVFQGAEGAYFVFRRRARCAATPRPSRPKPKSARLAGSGSCWLWPGVMAMRRKVSAVNN